MAARAKGLGDVVQELFQKLIHRWCAGCRCAARKPRFRKLPEILCTRAQYGCHVVNVTRLCPRPFPNVLHICIPTATCSWPRAGTTRYQPDQQGSHTVSAMLPPPQAGPFNPVPTPRPRPTSAAS